METALADLNRVSQVFDSGCSEEVQAFMCSVFFKQDDAGWMIKRKTPCREVCHRVWRSCQDALVSLLWMRPPVMMCEIYPLDDCYSDLSRPTTPVEILGAERVNFTHAEIECRATAPVVIANTISREIVSVSYHDEHTSHGGIHNFYVSLDSWDAHHVVLIPSSPYYPENEGPAVAVWIPNAGDLLPRHCERVEVMSCSRFGLDAKRNDSYFNYDNVNWTPPRELLQNWQTYFPEAVIDSDDGCLSQLYELLCHLTVPKCTPFKYIYYQPCRQFCEHVQTICNGTTELDWLLDSLPCDRLQNDRQGGYCVSGRTSHPELVVDVTQFENAIQVYCFVMGNVPATSVPEFYDREDNVIPATTSDSPSRMLVTQLSPRLVLLRNHNLHSGDSGTYHCRAGALSESFEVQPQRVSCMLAHNHTLCASLSETGYVQSPNFFGHTSQYQAEVAAYEFLPLLQTDCSEHLLHLVCAFYAPECWRDNFPYDTTEVMATKSREFCQDVKNACSEAASEIGFVWPRRARCELLPASGKIRPTQIPLRKRKKNCIYLRRYDITDGGVEYMFRGWADVQGQGAANDYCRVVSHGNAMILSCALAGTQGQSQYNYNSSYEISWLDLGHADTWYMKDEDGDGRDDYCRCVGTMPNTYTSCLKARENGFGAEFRVDGEVYDNCQYRRVNQFLGPGNF